METEPQAGGDHASKILHGLRRILGDCENTLNKLDTLIDKAKNKSLRLPVILRQVTRT
jgi:hypothetical protein